MEILEQNKIKIVALDENNKLPQITELPSKGYSTSSDYSKLKNKPTLNGIEISGDKESHDYNLAGLDDIADFVTQDDINDVVREDDISDFASINDLSETKFITGGFFAPMGTGMTPSATLGNTHPTRVKLYSARGGAYLYQDNVIYYLFQSPMPDMDMYYAQYLSDGVLRKTKIEFPYLKPFDRYDGNKIYRQTSDIIDLSLATECWQYSSSSYIDSSMMCVYIPLSNLGISNLSTTYPNAWLSHMPYGCCDWVNGISGFKGQLKPTVTIANNNLYILIPKSAYDSAPYPNISEYMLSKVKYVLELNKMTKFMYRTQQTHIEDYGGFELKVGESALVTTLTFPNQGETKWSCPSSTSLSFIKLDGSSYFVSTDGYISLPDLTKSISMNGTRYTTSSDGTVSLPNAATKIGMNGVTYNTTSSGLVSLPNTTTQVVMNGTTYSPSASGLVSLPNIATQVAINGTTYNSSVRGLVSLPNTVTKIEMDGKTFTPNKGVLSLPTPKTTIEKLTTYQTGDIDYSDSGMSDYKLSSKTKEISFPSDYKLDIADLLNKVVTTRTHRIKLGGVATNRSPYSDYKNFEKGNVAILSEFKGASLFNRDSSGRGKFIPVLDTSNQYSIRFKCSSKNGKSETVVWSGTNNPLGLYNMGEFDYYRLSDNGRIARYTSNTIHLEDIRDKDENNSIWRVEEDIIFAPSPSAFVYYSASLADLGILDIDLSDPLNCIMVNNPINILICQYEELTSPELLAKGGYVCAIRNNRLYFGFPTGFMNALGNGTTVTERMISMFNTTGYGCLVYKKITPTYEFIRPQVYDGLSDYLDSVSGSPSNTRADIEFLILNPTIDSVKVNNRIVNNIGGVVDITVDDDPPELKLLPSTISGASGTFKMYYGIARGCLHFKGHLQYNVANLINMYNGNDKRYIPLITSFPSELATILRRYHDTLVSYNSKTVNFNYLTNIFCHQTGKVYPVVTDVTGTGAYKLIIDVYDIIEGLSSQPNSLTNLTFEINSVVTL